ncbi:hypothetical protein Q4610_18115 [Sphingobium sp. HBC34]|uniref:DUF2783 domain-containing protein n=1 Tax=Sphingobium cyanobacteriorum TaxID=3063954 RepID=A0ABT8ZU26_9SPHN|nr:hypothetical protein [Sphingobium sp. HBC34]MDO7836966.1 hypothetical protein [Sphingobium sp. HBC34]
MDHDNFDLSGAEDCAELTQRVLDRLDMIMAEAPTEFAQQLMMAANHLQHARDLLDQAQAA